MKTKALKRFRSKLAKNEPVYGLWVTLESASITEMAVALGMDWVTIDAEHGHLDYMISLLEECPSIELILLDAFLPISGGLFRIESGESREYSSKVQR